MNNPNIAQLFKTKADRLKAQLGAPTGRVGFDSVNNLHYQEFEHGILYGRASNISRASELICSYGRLYEASQRPELKWLGCPLEDSYEAKDYNGCDIEVQRFQNGVVWCLKNEPDNEHNDVKFLAWRDWHAIKSPNQNNGDNSVPCSSKKSLCLRAIVFLIVATIFGVLAALLTRGFM